MCFSDGRQLELLLRQIYRPHNSYCLHIDPRSDEVFKTSARNIINCYDQRFQRKNMFLLENPINVTWSHISMLEADLLCIKVRRENDFNILFLFSYTISILSARLFLTSFLLGSLLWILEGFRRKKYNNLVHLLIKQNENFSPDYRSSRLGISEIQQYWVH